MGKDLIIGIMGQARSGKDTLAEMLAEELFEITRRKFVMMAYANELKLRVQKDFDLGYDQLWGNSKEIKDKRYMKTDNDYWTPREIMQNYGEFFRSIDDLFWVKNLFNVIAEKEYKNVIITDVRYPNEADPIVDRNGYVIKIDSNRKDKQTITNSNHISETAMKNYDRVSFTINNNGTLDDLRKTAKQVAELIIESEKIKSKLEEL